MIEWLAGISAGFAFKPILEDSPKKAQRRAARPFLAAFARARQDRSSLEWIRGKQWLLKY